MKDGQAWNTISKSFSEGIQFEDKPNVYLFHLESYNSPAAMEAIYGFDNADFKADLEKRAFSIYDRTFSNYPYIFASLAALFSMQHNYYSFAMGNMDGVGVRDVIGGKTYNPVLKVFLNNGYKCQYIYRPDYTFVGSDSLEYVFPKPDIGKAFWIYQSRLIRDILGKVLPGVDDSRNLNEEQIREIMRERIRIAASTPEPYFTFMDPYVTRHSYIDRDWKDMGEWIKVYPEQIQNS